MSDTDHSERLRQIDAELERLDESARDPGLSQEDRAEIEQKIGTLRQERGALDEDRKHQEWYEQG